MIRMILIALLAAGVALACASTTESDPAPAAKSERTAKAEPVQKSEPARTQVSTPAQLPKTASPMPLVGLAGVAALALGVGTRALRRRL
jgi:ABC-type Fe3+-hydroxamate transport system substrate-binding protein